MVALARGFERGSNRPCSLGPVEARETVDFAGEAQAELPVGIEALAGVSTTGSGSGVGRGALRCYEGVDPGSKEPA